MKRLIGIILAVMIAGTLSAQVPNALRYPFTIGMGAPGTVTGGVLNLRGLTSGSVQLKVPAAAGTGTIFQLPATNGTSGQVLKTNGSGVLTWNPAIEAGEQTPGVAVADTAAMLTPYSHKLNPTFTGVPAAPTAAGGTNTTQIATTAFVTAAHPVDFVIRCDPGSFTTPLDNTLYYYGAFETIGMGTSANGFNVNAIIIPFNCTLVGFALITRSAAACTAETGTLSVRINNTTDVQLSNVVTWGVGGAYATNYFSGVEFTTNLTAGDKIIMKLLTPTWATDATSILMDIHLYFKNR